MYSARLEDTGVGNGNMDAMDRQSRLRQQAVTVEQFGGTVGLRYRIDLNEGT